MNARQYILKRGLKMIRLNPCIIFLGASLTTGALSIALLCGFGWLGMVVFCLKEYDVHIHPEDRRADVSHYMMTDDKANTYLYTGMFALFNNIFSLVLWCGALKRSRNLCLLWLAESTIVAAVLAARVLFYDIMYYRVEASLLLFYLYSLWVVWEFIDQKIEPERRARGALPVTTARPPTPPACRGTTVAQEKTKRQKDADKFAEKLMKKWMESIAQPHHPYLGNPLVISSSV